MCADSTSRFYLNTDDMDYYYLPEGTDASQNLTNAHHEHPIPDNVYNLADDVPSEYTLAEEVTSVQPAKSMKQTVTSADRDYDMAGQVSAGQMSEQNRGDYDLADDDEYQLAGATGDEYENFTSIQRFVKS